MKIPIILFLLFLSNSIFSQTTRKIVKDFDGDSKKDAVRIDSDKRTLICLLSTQKFKKVESGEIQRLNFGNTLVSTKNGFEFWNDFDRSGFRCVFEYNKNAKKMQLIQMRRVDDILSFDYGDKAKGLSTLNLVTNKYVGNFYQVFKKKLIKMPIIYAEMIFPQTYLETFSDTICFTYEARCIALYEREKNK